MGEIQYISKVQLFLMIMGNTFGDTILFNPSAIMKQAAWLSFILGWGSGIVLMLLYVYIYELNPSKTLTEILQESFGRYLGWIVSLFYIWYFLHLAAVVFRDMGEFLVTTIYPETPMVVIISVFGAVTAYVLRQGINVIGRTTELFIPLLIAVQLTLSILPIIRLDYTNLFPLFEPGIPTIIKGGFQFLQFPFGENIPFLMIFFHLISGENIKRTAIYAVLTVGFILLLNILKVIMILGPGLMTKSVFPEYFISKLIIPSMDMGPFVTVVLLIGSGIKTIICLYAASLGISQMTDTKTYRIFVLPVTAIAVGLSLWLYDNIFQMIRFGTEIWPYYALPFQIIIPFIILVISWIKHRTQKEKMRSQ